MNIPLPFTYWSQAIFILVPATPGVTRVELGVQAVQLVEEAETKT